MRTVGPFHGPLPPGIQLPVGAAAAVEPDMIPQAPGRAPIGKAGKLEKRLGGRAGLHGERPADRTLNR